MIVSPLNPPIEDWRGKRIWLIGASTGIGAALAAALAQQGAEVALSARNRDALAQLQQSLGKVQVLPMDATEPNDWVRAFGELSQVWDRIDLVAFCMADYQPQRAWEVSGDAARRMVDVNLVSVYRGLEQVLPRMLEQGRGGLLLIASVAGYMGLPNATVYGPTKAALINLAQILYADLHPKGLSVYLVNPGFVSTRLTQKNDFKMPALLTPDQAAQEILGGMARGNFEIDFPRRFTLPLRWASLLPHRLRFSLLGRMLKLP